MCVCGCINAICLTYCIVLFLIFMLPCPYSYMRRKHWLVILGGIHTTYWYNNIIIVFDKMIILVAHTVYGSVNFSTFKMTFCCYVMCQFRFFFSFAFLHLFHFFDYSDTNRLFGFDIWFIKMTQEIGFGLDWFIFFLLYMMGLRVNWPRRWQLCRMLRNMKIKKKNWNIWQVQW